MSRGSGWKDRCKSLALPLPSCVTLGKLLNLPES